MTHTDTDHDSATLDRVRTILSHRLEHRITEREAIDELVAQIEAAGYNVMDPNEA